MTRAAPVAARRRETPGTETAEPRRAVVFGGLILVLLLAALDSTIVATALPTIVGELGGLERLSWVVTAYLLAQTVVTPLYGKLGDLYGRKRVLQVAVAIFLVGSALCGMARSMPQLVVFRAIQGLGGGGLMVGSQAAIGDVVPPRERGRYQGIFGAAFGVASIAGPLVGGFITSHFSWRWIFYVNLPLGLIALAVLAVALPALATRVRHQIDYLGALLLAVALASVVLVADLGGAHYAWGSGQIAGLALAGAIATVLFVLVERRAAEPVLPLRLFRNRVFVVSGGIGLIVGFALFGAVTYLPLWLQVVRRQSPTGSGLQLVPMMAGMLVTSIAAGQLISRRGRYRAFPIAGTAILTGGLLLLSRLEPDLGAAALSLRLVALGVGLGLVMQVLVLAVQNAVDYEDLGVATSGATLFRFIGGSVGTAVLGAVFTGRLAGELGRAGLDLGPGEGLQLRPDVLAGLDAAARGTFDLLFSRSLGFAFLVAAAAAAVGFVLALRLEERPLRETVAARAGDVGDAFAAPGPEDPLAQIERSLAALASRDTQRAMLVRAAGRAGIDLGPAACWLLGKVAADPAADPHELAVRHQVEPQRLADALALLRDRGLLDELPGAGGVERRLTAAGHEQLSRLVAARRAELAAALSPWGPETHGDLAALLADVARHFDDRAPARAATAGAGSPHHT